MTGVELRLLDANTNRAAEGIRVAEDIARFLLNDESRTRELRTLRHLVRELAMALAGSRTAPLELRDVAGDVGASMGEVGKLAPAGLADLVRTNCRRAEEAIRVAEELSRLRKPEVAAEYQAARFRLYSMEAELVKLLVRRSAGRLGEVLQEKGRPLLYLILDTGLLEGEDATRISGSLVDAGVDILQLRAKGLEGRSLGGLAGQIHDVCSRRGVPFVVNDRPDVARAVGADGVHVGREDMRLSDVRSVLGVGQFVGVSTHNVEEAQAADSEGADYVSVGPVFSTHTKQEAGPAVGPGLVREVVGRVSKPVCAVGGIGPSNLAGVLDAGASMVAVSRAILGSQDPGEAARGMLSRIKEYSRSREVNREQRE